MNIEAQSLAFLTELLGVVMRHDPLTAAKSASVYDRRIEPREAAK